MKSLVVLLLLISCGFKVGFDSRPIEKRIKKNKNKMECIKVQNRTFDNIRRCENEEAVCYHYIGFYKSGLSCFKKQFIGDKK